MLRDLFGNTSVAKLLDFLLENRFWNYTKKDIAKGAGISRTQIYRLWNLIVELGLVKESGRKGRAKLYRANMSSPIMRRLSELSMEIANELNRGENNGVEKKKQI